MTLPDLSVQKHQEIFQLTQIGAAIGNADLIRAMFDESAKYWNAAVNGDNGSHLIEGVVMNTESKAVAINDYVLQLVQLFISSRYPTLSLLTKRAFALNVEHRKSVIYRMSAVRFNNNYELFRAVVTELLCFDPFVTEMALCGSSEERAVALTKFIASANGDYLSEDDWNPTHEELREKLLTVDFSQNRKELINAFLKASLAQPAGVDIYQLIGTGIDEIAQ